MNFDPNKIKRYNHFSASFVPGSGSYLVAATDYDLLLARYRSLERTLSQVKELLTPEESAWAV